MTDDLGVARRRRLVRWMFAAALAACACVIVLGIAMRPRDSARARELEAAASMAIVIGQYPQALRDIVAAARERGGLTDELRALAGKAIDHAGQIATFEHPDAVTSIAWSPDGRSIATASTILAIWDLAARTKVTSPKARFVTWRGDQIVGATTRPVVWSAAGEVRATRFLGDGDIAVAFAVQPSTGAVVAAGINGNLAWWDASGRELGRGIAKVKKLAWAPSAAMYVMCRDEGVQTMYGWGSAVQADGKLASEVSGRRLSDEPCDDVEVSPLENQVGFASERGGYTIAWISDGRAAEQGPAPAYAVRFKPGSADFAVARGDAVEIHGARTAVLGPARDAAWSADGTRLATRDAKGGIAVYDTATWTSLATWTTGGTIVALAWSPDGKTLATGGLDRALRLWRVAPEHDGAPFAGTLDELAARL